MKIIDPSIQFALNKANMHKLQTEIESSCSLKRSSLEILSSRQLNSLEKIWLELDYSEQDQALASRLTSLLDLFLHVDRAWNLWDLYVNKKELESTLFEHSIYYNNSCAVNWQCRVTDNEKLIFGSLHLTEWDLILTSSTLVGINFNSTTEQSFVFSLPLKKNDIEEFLRLTQPNYNSRIESWLTKQ